MNLRFWRRSIGPKPHKHSWEVTTIVETARFGAWSKHLRKFRECETCGQMEILVEWWRNWKGETFQENPS